MRSTARSWRGEEASRHHPRSPSRVPARPCALRAAATGLGDRFSAAAREALEMIENFPGAGEPVERLEGDTRIRKMAMRIFPYHIVYLELAETTEAIAFAHDRRQEGYWRARLKRHPQIG